jgi:hypothetical protein
MTRSPDHVTVGRVSESESEFVTLCHCGSLEAAQKARALLEAEGISVRIDGEHGSAIFGGSNAILDVRVWVPETQLDEAQRIIDEFEGPQPDADEDAVGEGEEDGDEQADQATPSRYPPWMRRGGKWTWPACALGGLGLIATGEYLEGVGSLLAAVVLWQLAQDSDESSK